MQKIVDRFWEYFANPFFGVGLVVFLGLSAVWALMLLPEAALIPALLILCLVSMALGALYEDHR